jgi:hypothetical protein
MGKEYVEKGSNAGLDWLVRHTKNDPFFVSHALAQYKAICDVDDEHLMGVLGCNRRALIRLALCRLPDDRDPTFRQVVQEIATFVSCNADGLIGVFREAAAFASLREGTGSTSGLLIAARDRNAGETGHRPNRHKTKRPKR